MIEYLKGHTSAESALIVDDYPYGFRLRCKIRYWLEYKDGFGFRFVSQTTNPKKSVETWNKPKARVYCDGPSFLIRNANNHISWTGFYLGSLTEAMARDILTTHAEKLPREFIPKLEQFIKFKAEYDRLKDEGVPFQKAGFLAVRRTMPASSLKLPLRDKISAHFQGAAPDLTPLMDSGTIGDLEDYLDLFNLTFKDFIEEKHEV